MPNRPRTTSGTRRALCFGMAVMACLAAPAVAIASLDSDYGHAQAVQSGPNELYVAPAADGLYYIYARVNGAHVKFVIDSGSDDVVLTDRDARRAGIDVSRLKFTHEYDAETGSGMEANTKLREFSIGGLSMTDFPVAVSEDGGASLLGMPFLRRMKSVEIRDNRLYLRW